jgi:hypothetical protein
MLKMSLWVMVEVNFEPKVAPVDVVNAKAGSLYESLRLEARENCDISESSDPAPCSLFLLIIN